MSGRKTLKQILMGLLGGVLFLSACGQTSPATQTATIPVVDTVTLTRSPIPTNTNTSVPTETLTSTITPLPTVPTFTPTFDVSTIVTVTPAPKAECPKDNNSLMLNFRFDDYSIDSDQEIPKFLNMGGTRRKITSELSRVYSEHSYRFTDLTNDGVSDLIFDGFRQLYDTFYILWCQDGQYSLFSGEDAMGVSMGNRIYQIVDMNKNGLPELVIYTSGCTGNGCYRFFIGEWNGKTFVNLAPKAYLEGVNKIEIKDVNHDGTLELILVGGSYDFKAPWRQSIHTYMWDGNNFAEQSIEYLQPNYRFQAIQDGDAATIIGQQDRASRLYQQAVFDSNLEWWSSALQKYEQDKIDAIWLNEPTPSAKPLEDKTEYPRLAAYAYYQIMLLKLVQGQESDATATYNTLQQKFGNDQYGRPYVEMATSFWNAYQSTHKMYDSCAAAIEYAAEHPEILTPLGSDYHGSQSHIYVPADVCPFR